MGELGECGVVGQGGRLSRPSKPAEGESEPRGSYMKTEQRGRSRVAEMRKTKD